MSRAADDPHPTRWVKISAVIPADLYIVWDEVRDSLADHGVIHDSDVVRNGMVLEVLCADYIASTRTRKKKA